MQPGKSPRRRAWPASIVAAAAIGALASALSPSGALAPASAIAAVAPPGDGALSPRLAALAKPALRSAPPDEQAQALSLAAEGPGSLVRDGNRVLVEVRFDSGAAASAADLRQAGAQVVNVSPQYQTVTVAAKPDELRALNGVPGVAAATEVLSPVTAESTCPSGAVVSEGVQQLHAGEARQTFEVDGSGVTVGILSDSYNRATEAADGSGPVATTASTDVKEGDLPGTGNTCAGEETAVGVLDDTESNGADEGRAMAQIVHDVAPGAKLAFATAFRGETAFARNIETLAKPAGEGAGAQVIADDVSYYGEPFFQEGPIATAIRKVTAEHGVTYLSAAGNDNLIVGGHDVASWETPEFRDAGVCSPGVVALSEEIEAEEQERGHPGVNLNPNHCLDFNPDPEHVDKTFGIKVAPGATLNADVQWAEPWYGVETDIDAYLLNSSGAVISESLEDNVHRSKTPFELIQWENTSESTATVQLALNRYSGGLPRLKLALLENGGGVAGTEYPRSSGPDVVGPTVYGHSASVDALSTGATPFGGSPPIERYSSRGPATDYFGPVEGEEPAEALTPPETVAKPDLLATDCGATTFFASLVESSWRFCGTSAAAPHAAGVAALMLSKQPASPSEVRDALLAGATPGEGSDGCASGAGLVEAVGAIDALAAHAGPTAPSCAPPTSEVPVSEAQASGYWGSESEPYEVIETHVDAGSPIPVAPVVEIPTAYSPSSSTNRSGKRLTPPATFFRHHPPGVVRTSGRTSRAVFVFGSDQGAVTFLCKADRGRFHRCDGRFVRRYRLGPHVLRVKARRNSDGATDATPAVHRFRVKRARHRPIKRRHSRHHHRS